MKRQARWSESPRQVVTLFLGRRGLGRYSAGAGDAAAMVLSWVAARKSYKLAAFLELQARRARGAR